MTDLDAEALGFAVLQDCKTLGNATPQQLASSLDWLDEAQDHLARAIEKARQVRKAA